MKTMKTMKTWMAVILGALIISAVGFGIQQTFANPSERPMSLEEVSKKVTDKYSGIITEVELDKEKGKHVYEVELIGEHGEYEVKLDAVTGDILRVKQKPNHISKENDKLETGEENEQKNIDKSPSTSTMLSAEEASRIALEKVPGTIEEIELDHDDGLLVYEIEIRTETGEAELEVNAYTGEIVFMSMETKND